MTDLETDYLVVGAGAAGMAFADELIAHSDANVILVERRDAPGGHWNDAYPFVRLHQSSATYGVNSRHLGGDMIDRSGLNAGLYERAAGPEICDHFRRALDELLASGQARFLGMCDYSGDWADAHTITSRVTGTATPVRVRRRVVDTTYLDVKVPATHTPSFTVDPEAQLIPIGDLVHLAEAPTGFTVIGAGKTAMDACTWLLERGVDPDRIRWIRPRDSWAHDRASFQPLELVGATMEALGTWVECLSGAQSLPDLFGQLEECGELLRLDPAVQPSMYRGAILSKAELALLRQIERVIRHGQVRHLGADRIVLDQGEIPTDRGQIHIDCTAAGFRCAPERPIFAPGRITLQSLVGGFTTTYAALVAFIEATRDNDTEKNRLTPPTRQLSVPSDWVAVIRGFLRSSALLAAEPDLAAWMDSARLSLAAGLSQRMHDPQIAAAMARTEQHTESALHNAELLLASAPAPGIVDNESNQVA